MEYNNKIHKMYIRIDKQKNLDFLYLSLAITTSLMSSPYVGFAASENNTLMQPQGKQGMTTAANTTNTNIILVHGAWADGSSWNKVIPILHQAGHKVIAVELPLHSLSDDVETVKRAISRVGGPVALVGHSYGGAVITNAAHNNPNVTGLVYIAAFAPDEGQSLADFVSPANFPKELIQPDNGGFLYLNPTIFRENFAQDVDPAEANIMAIAQKPFN
jgi:pimeloyl-ACP methyl ester carboxylesterase